MPFAAAGGVTSAVSVPASVSLRVARGLPVPQFLAVGVLQAHSGSSTSRSRLAKSPPKALR
ncbi:hypothetical protein ACFQ0B_49905 [Nonomuraea thailandensis]